MKPRPARPIRLLWPTDSRCHLAECLPQKRERLVDLLLGNDERRVDSHARRVRHGDNPATEQSVEQPAALGGGPGRRVLRRNQIETEKEPLSPHVGKRWMSIREGEQAVAKSRAESPGIFGELLLDDDAHTGLDGCTREWIAAITRGREA